MKTSHALLLFASLSTSLTLSAAPNERALAVSKYWTAERMAAAQPRDFVLDHRGLAYLKGKGGVLKPYGHNVPATPEPRAKGGGGGKPGGGSGGGSGGDTGGTEFVDIKNSPWTNGGNIQNAAGRIYFIMSGVPYVCSGTLIDDGIEGPDGDGKSIILTAAHCVYDDINKKFAEAAIFIPNQVASGTSTDKNCSNDVLGCWIADFGIVSVNWSTGEFPDNIPWDYAFYVVGNLSDTLFLGSGQPKDLDLVVTPMKISFSGTDVTKYTRALGYSYRDDPNFMYCGENLSTGYLDSLLLPNCGLSGGASGGPWSQSQEQDLGQGPIISVNSYGPARGKPYMGGPQLYGNDAECLFEAAKVINANQIGC